MKHESKGLLPFALWVGLALSAAVAVSQEDAAPPGPADFPPTPLPLELEEGDVFLFLGDSITHQALYTQFLETHFLCCYPDTDVVFWNSGVGGDRAAHALARFDADVASRRPVHVSVLLGMNDGQYADFDAEVVATYQSGMSDLLERISGIGARAIVLSPTMFDHGTVARRKDDETWRFRTRTFSKDYNALMAYFGAWALEESGRRRQDQGHRGPGGPC